MGKGREQQTTLGPDARADRGPARPVPLLLRILAFSTFFFPSSMVIGPLGAVGTVPMILGGMLLALWLASAMFGLHDPIESRYPAQVAIALLLLVTFASYVALYSGWTGPSTVAGRASADRWLVLVLVSAAIALAVAETVKSVAHALVLVRALLSGAYVCSAVALVQFQFGINPVGWLQQAMLGFEYNGGDTTFQERGALVRVAGTTFSPIELAVLCSMLLPLSVWRSVNDPHGRRWMHWSGTALLVFALALTVSRSGILGVVVGMLVFLPFLSGAGRRWVLLAAPVGLAGIFLTVPGLLSTLADSLTAGESDPSISTRTDNWPRVVAFVEERPWLGVGPGTYMPDNALFILDNQYLNALVTMGSIGLIGMTCYLVLPGVAALVVARALVEPVSRALAGAVAAGGLVAGVCSLTFDSLSFPVFALTYPMFVGLSGAVWLMAGRRSTPTEGEISWTR
ncbi:O-antigen ligase family protein [Arthrobacter agilis]|uniref:O-antigen ligase family protein n=1 Tax=Arthrobacter agilis TaxID=37921 RepID=UPI002365DEA7|nr:O-antigen ligase family protein [Arthrobacter agilis]WDF34217.1 O-antigen ligase family protein [Arthrobacter agilis]